MDEKDILLVIIARNSVSPGKSFDSIAGEAAKYPGLSSEKLRDVIHECLALQYISENNGKYSVTLKGLQYLSRSTYAKNITEYANTFYDKQYSWWVKCIIYFISFLVAGFIIYKFL